MHVINVDGSEIHVAQRLVHLIFQITLRHAMNPSSDFTPRRDPGLDESTFHVLTHIAGWRAIEREVAAFRANDHLVAGKSTTRQLIQRGANYSLASLKAVIRRGVDYVGAQFDCAHDRVAVAAIGFVISIAEVGSGAHRRKPQILLQTKVVWRRVRETFAIARGAFNRRATFQRHYSHTDFVRIKIAR